MSDNDNYTNKAWKAITPSQNPAWTSLENNIYGMVRNIEFRNVRNDFQDKPKEDIDEIRSFIRLFVFATKSANLYEISDTDCNGFLGNKMPVIVENMKTVLRIKSTKWLEK